MTTYPKTIIIRHRRENLKKCSLRGLEQCTSHTFYSYPLKKSLSFDHCCLLTPGALPLSLADRDRPLLLLDGTWRLAQKMLDNISLPSYRRSIPDGFVTAYPRRQEIDCGLASIEALYVAYHIFEASTEGLFDNYHFGKAFLEKNRALLLHSDTGSIRC